MWSSHITGFSEPWEFCRYSLGERSNHFFNVAIHVLCMTLKRCIFVYLLICLLMNLEGQIIFTTGRNCVTHHYADGHTCDNSNDRAGRKPHLLCISHLISRRHAKRTFQILNSQSVKQINMLQSSRWEKLQPRQGKGHLNYSHEK